MTATVGLPPTIKFREVDSNGNALVGGLLYTYAAGSVTKQPTYTDATGATPQTNPIVLDARGEASFWPDSTLAYKYVLAPAGDTDPPSAPIWTIDNVPASGAGVTSLKTQLASTANGNGVDLIGGAGRVVSSVAAIRSLLKTGIGSAFAQGYYAAGDGGGGQYYCNLADTTSVDNGGTVLVAADGGRWKLASTTGITARQFGAHGDGATDDTAPLTAYASSNLNMVFPAGNFLFGTQLQLDYSSSSFPGDTYTSNRRSINGETMGTTLLQWTGGNSVAVLMNGPALGNYQGVYGRDNVRDLQMFCATRNQLGTGLEILNKTWVNVENFVSAYFSNGLVLDGALLCNFKNSHFRLGNYGMQWNATQYQTYGNGLINNANTFTHCDWSDNLLAGWVANSIGAGNLIEGFACEYNGTGIASASPPVNTGGFILVCNTNSGGNILSLKGGYFEGNGGQADLYVTNPTGVDVVIDVDTVVFNRVSSGQYTNYNIYGQNTGGGSITFNLRNCSFNSAGTYVPSASRPFWGGDSKTRFNVENAKYNESTSQVNFASGGVTIGGRVNANGTALALPSHLTVAHTGTGVYTITSTIPFGPSLTGLDYVVAATSCYAAGGEVVQHVSYVNNVSFQVVSTTMAGTAADGDFSFLIQPLR